MSCNNNILFDVVLIIFLLLNLKILIISYFTYIYNLLIKKFVFLRMYIFLYL